MQDHNQSLLTSDGALKTHEKTKINNNLIFKIFLCDIRLELLIKAALMSHLQWM